MKSKQQQDRFFLGMGAVTLPVVFALLIMVPDAALTAMPPIYKVVGGVVTGGTMLGTIICWVVGLANWEENETD